MRQLAGILLAIFVLSPGAASAESAYSVNAHFFRPALFNQGIFTVDRAAELTKYQAGFKFYFNQEFTPLRLGFPGVGREDILTSSQTFHFMGQLAVSSRLELALDIPVVRQSLTSNPNETVVEGYERLTQNDLRQNISPGDVAPMDTRLGVKFHIMKWAGLSLSAAVIGTLPFGEENTFAGDQFFTVEPKLLFGYDIGPVAVALNAGYLLRKRTIVRWDDPDTEDPELPLLDSNDELTFGLGVLYSPHWRFAVGAELVGTVPLMTGSYDVVTKQTIYEPNGECTPEVPGSPCEVITTQSLDVPNPVVMEALGGVVIKPMRELNVVIGAGAGVLGDERRTALRIFAGVGWMPGSAASITAGDRDKDGVSDDRDECPGQPEDKDGFQDEDGCPDPDNDGDGVDDKVDKCLTEPEDVDGFDDADGCPDLDNDGDGVLDAKDSCPNEAEDKDGFQDEDGCPDSDNDGDGISDKVDQCPNQPETVNQYQDGDGCPDEVKGQVTVGPKSISIPQQIQFKRGSAVIDPVSYKLLDEIADKIRKAPQAGRIRIEGHTDNTGTKQRNQVLSQERADSVRAYLVRKGVAARRLQSVGYGSTRAIASNKTKEGRQKNRRVEFIVVKAKKEGAAANE